MVAERDERDSAASRQDARVLYIAGSGRSGSTLLERMLGNVPGFLPAGELKNIWARGFGDNQLCSCGTPFLECDFWRSVVRDAFGDRIPPSHASLARFDRERVRYRYVPLAQSARLRSKRFAAELAEYETTVRPLYLSLAERPGVSAIVDSSKNIPYAFLLAAMSQIEVHVVHLVRDSRAVAYSWQKRVRRPEVTSHSEYMGGFDPSVSALRWDAKNVAAELLRLTASSYTRARYEDLVAEPGRTLAAILEPLGAEPPPLPRAGAVAVPPVYHTVSGNPIRFERGALAIRPDLDWQTSLDPMGKFAATALTLPLLLRYGYVPSRTSKPKAESPSSPTSVGPGAQR
jgi:hypothetical protein